jgi:hypothetical protein
MEQIMKRLLLLSIFSLSIAVAACSSSDSGSSNGSSSSTASTERIVYLADQDINDVFELYLGGSSIKLNPPLSQGKNVLDFQITPDKTAVVYRADQDTNDVFELYRVEFANPGVSTKLNGSLPVGGDVWRAVITPDSSSVLYVADQTTDGVTELYRVPFATPGVSTKLNGRLVPGGNVFFEIGTTPDSSAVVYRATQASAKIIELYRVPLATPGVSAKLNGALPPNADVSPFLITPNGTVVVYTVFQRFPNNPLPGGIDVLMELDSVAFATPGQSTKLSGPVDLNAPHDPTVLVSEYQITPDSSAVVYSLSDAHGGDVIRFLYRVPFATPGQSTQLIWSTSVLPVVRTFKIRPDSSGVVVETQPLSSARHELFLISFANPAVSTKLNGPLVVAGRIPNEENIEFAIAPDNSSVVYVTDQTTPDVNELHRVPFATPGVSTKLNGPLVAGGGVEGFGSGTPPFLITPDSSAVLYQASQTTVGMFELYRVPFATPGISSTLNGPLVAGGNVRDAKVQ